MHDLFDVPVQLLGASLCLRPLIDHVYSWLLVYAWEDCGRFGPRMAIGFPVLLLCCEVALVWQPNNLGPCCCYFLPLQCGLHPLRIRCKCSMCMIWYVYLYGKTGHLVFGDKFGCMEATQCMNT